MSFTLRALKSSIRSQPRLLTGVRQFQTTPRRATQYLKANEETFEKVVLNNAGQDKVVLVDFYADWCRPCTMLSPILEQLTDDPSVKTGTGASLDLVTVDTDKEIDLARKYEIRSLPTVIAFKNGEPVDQFIGALNESGVRNFLKKI